MVLYYKAKPIVGQLGAFSNSTVLIIYSNVPTNEHAFSIITVIHALLLCYMRPYYNFTACSIDHYYVMV